MYYRREVLKLGLQAGAYLSAATPSIAQTSAPPVPDPSAQFDSNIVLNLARTLAAKPFKAPDTSLPSPFSSLSYENYVSIRSQAGSPVWVADGLGFAIEPLHRGFIFTTPMDIHIVDGNKISRIPYDRARFDFNKLQVGPDIKDIGYSGFRILESRNGGFDEIAIFQGASFFRALAKDQTQGVMARALAIRTADPRGEEFPIIRAVWIEKPTATSKVLVIHALLDSESLTGAYRFTVRLNDATIIDTESTLVPRIAVDNFGIGAMQATSFYSPLDRHNSDDLRPAVYEVSGLRMLSGKDEWLWRPVSNRLNLQGSAFVDDSPRGFGLLQRDRDPSAFEDDEQHWERRPSLWIEPIADWGAGQFELIEIPTESEINQNINAYWRPKEVLKPGKETSFSYRQFWCWSPPLKPTLAIATQARSGKVIVGGKSRRRIFVDFSGDILGDPSRIAEIKASLSLTGATATSVKSYSGKNPKTIRVLFDFEPNSDNMAEIRLLLQSDGQAVSETWLYRWTA